MPILITLFLVMIWAQILSWLYATINPFIQQLGSIQRYNIAYYGAIWWVERAYLVLRWHEAWFTWSWWFIDQSTYWNSSDYKFQSKKYFWQLSLTWMWNWFSWKIDGLTDSNWVIPATWNWDLDPDISSWNDYKKLTFDRSLQYAFYKDITSSDWYYTWVKDNNIKNIKLDTQDLKVSIRVPIKLYNKYWWSSTNLLDKDSNIDLDDDDINNDVIVNRTLFGYTWDTQFTIFPTVDVNYNNGSVNGTDTTIREWNINYYTTDNNNISFVTITSSKDTNPNAWWWNTTDVSKFNQSPDWAVWTWFDLILKGKVWDTFDSSKTNSQISKMHLKLSLVNYLKYTQEQIYPYLEVKLNAWKQIPKLDFDIVWRWKAWEYDVSIKLKKPVFEATSASDFTILF